MKFTFKPSPNYRQQQSTQSIMLELTLGLLVVFGFSVVYYAMAHGANYAVRALLLMVVSLVCAVGTEALWCVALKKDIKEHMQSSFPWVTAIILTLMCRVDISYYALGVSTVMAIFFGKLVFGGFGQNLFNPAAVGRAIIFASFTGSVAADLISYATPTAAIAGHNWLLSIPSSISTTCAAATSCSGTLVAAPTLGELMMGTYAGAMGETSLLIIVAVGAFLAYRGVIDWRVPVTYMGTLFVLATVYGLMFGQPLTYGLYHLALGGAAFGAVFMMTDPVTNPTSAAGRVVFAMGCAILTLMIRVKANLPEGVLYSILLMNMMTPAIEKMMDGNQIKTEKKNWMIIAIVAAVGVCAAVVCAMANM
ncbi:MAG: RnfABCDGE type electron transport complex subunit D [Erysipelotrichaceae bacterium]|nr:RnfABCDGE type electron transport complex subunit D [Erysipelotrichaceae bacterium]